MSKASMGVRTIALRIAGTKEAKEELEELGEDTSDFVVQTQSKVDAQVRNLTKTESNPNGISVLDENGRLRNTYDVLLDIAKVYDEIVAKDNQMGTNTSNALLELLAGKTRSNILASILQNPQLLEDAYEQSKNSKGIGQKELDVYLDSVEAKMAKMQNRIQELAYTAFDSDFIKTFIDGLTEALKIVTKIVDTAGLLPTLLGAVGGFALQKSGLGLAKYDRIQGTWGLGGMPGAISGLFKKATTKYTPNQEVAAYLAGFDPSRALYGKGGALEGVNLGKAPQALREYTEEALRAGNATATVGDALRETGTSITGFSGLLSNAGSLLTSFLSTMGTMAIVMAASWAIGEIAKGIWNLIHAEENMIKKGKEATDSINDRYKAYEDLRDGLEDLGKSASGKDDDLTTSESISEISEKYAELHKGVNALNNENRDLSTEKYQEYLDLCKQLAEQSPELVKGYDNQGNAILNLGSTAAEAESALMRMYEAQKLAANVEIGQDIQDSYDGFITQIDNKDDENDKLQNQIDELNGQIEENNKKQSSANTSITGDYLTVYDYQPQVQDALNELIKEFGLGHWSSIGDMSKFGGRVDFQINGLDDLDDETAQQLQNRLGEIIAANLDIESNELTAERDEKLLQQSANELFIKDQTKSIQGIITKYLTTSDVFGEQSDAIQNAILGNLDSLDLSVIEDKYKGQIVPYIYGELIAPLDKLGPDVQEKISKLFEVKPDGQSAQSYIQQMVDIINDTFTNEADRVRWGQLFGVDDIQNEINTLTSNIKDEFTDNVGNVYLTPDQIGELTGLSLDDLRTYSELVQEGVYTTWEELQAEFERRKKTREIKPTNTLSDVLNDESYKETAETSASNLSTLTGALETLRTEGHLTAEEMRDLQEAFPDLTEFTTEAIQAKAFEELDKQIDTLREKMADMTPEGVKQMQTYMRNMIDSYGDLGVSLEKIREEYIDVSAEGTTRRDKLNAGNKFDSQVEELRSRLAEEGIELDTHVLYTLVAQDEFSGTAEEILEKYKDEKFFWEIILENQEFEKDITKQQALANNYQAMREAKQAKGETITSADYGDLGALDQIANDRRGEAENAWKFYVNASEEDKDAAYVAWIDAETAARQAEAEALSKYQESVEAGANDELKNLNDNNNVITDLQNDISKAELNGGKASRKMYEDLAKAQENSATINNNLADLWQGFADSERKKGKNANQALITTWEQQAAEYRAAAIQAEADARENYANPTLEEYNQLQNESNEIQRDITKAEQKNQKVSKQTYRDLLANGQKQIRNLRQQQEEVADFGEEWWNLQNDIESMQDSMFEWGQSLDRIVYDQAAALADAINTAISESASGTGLTSETINALITGFSDLSGKQFDLSDMFYNTADGVKVNTEAVRELTDAEFDLQAVQIQNEIDQVQQALDKNPGNSALQEKLQTLMQTQAQYFAQYEEMQKALSYNNAITVAEGTENAGANYDANYARVKTYKEAREKGLIGTDEFKAWTSYLDVYGRDTIDAYDAVSTKIDRYFTEDASEGLSNFLVDMEKLGYAAQDADGYWTITADDYNAAAQDMQMGSEWFMDTMRKLEDFGMIHTYVSSLTEAQLKTQDVEGQIAQAVQTYQNMLEMGASDEELQKQVDKIHELESAWSDVNYVAATWEDVTAENRAEEFLGLEDRLISLSELYAKADTKAGRDAASNAAQDYVKQFGMTLDEELAKQGVFQLSAESQIEYDSRMPDFGFSFDNLEQKMLKQGQGGNVDLLARPLVDAAKLVEAGWEDAGEGIATVYSSTFSNEDGSVAMNFTPILTDENGNFDRVLSPDELQKYAEEVIAGTSTDDLNLQIGAEFTGDYAVENAEMAAEKIHELQDVYYGEDLQNFKEYYDNNTEAAEGYLSVLAKVPRDTLEKISLSNNNYEVDHEVEDAFQGLADALGYTNENAGQLLALLDALGIDLSELEVPDAAQDGLIKLQDTLSKVEKYPGIKYNIDLEPDYSQMTPEEIQSQIDEIDLFEHNINLEDEDVLAYLEELKENANIQLDIQTKLQGGDFTLPELKRLIDAGDDEGLAAELGIDMTQEGAEDQLARYKKMLQDMPQSYDMVIHIDDSQFTDLLNTIVTGELPVVEFDSELNEEGVEEGAKETKKKIEKTPITQTIVQKVKQGAQNLKQGVQNVGSAISNIFSGGQQATTKAGMDTSGVEQGTKEIKQDVAKVNKMSGTATVQVNTDQANAKINALRNNLLLLNQLVVAPQFNESAIVRAITRTDTLIQKLQRAQQLKQSSAIGTAHARGTALSHSYAGGTQDWTVGEDESALVNEIGQESIVRDGVWQLIPGGPHVEDLKKDDIINKCDFIR